MYLTITKHLCSEHSVHRDGFGNIINTLIRFCMEKENTPEKWYNRTLAKSIWSGALRGLIQYSIAHIDKIAAWML